MEILQLMLILKMEVKQEQLLILSTTISMQPMGAMIMIQQLSA
jgi:hypothetical protein